MNGEPKTRKKVDTNIGPKMHCFRVITIFMLKFEIALLSNFFVKIETWDGFYDFQNITKVK